jgi:hypothetical protein
MGNKAEDRGARQYIRVPAAALPVGEPGTLQRDERETPANHFLVQLTRQAVSF